MRKKGFFNSFRPPFAPLVLPAVYDDVLSYEEWLAKVIQHINELSEYINETLEHIDELIKADVQEEIADLKALYDGKIADLQRQINALVSDLSDTNGRIDGLDAKVERHYNTLLAYIDEKLLELKASFNASIYDFFLLNKQYTDTKVNTERIYRRADIKALNDRLDSYVREWPLVYCPPIGNYTDVESSIVYCWDSLRYFCLTAKEYDEFQFTCEEYANLLFTAFEYDVWSRFLLKESIKDMFNPFTGARENIRDVINYMATLLKYNAKTAAEYDGYNFTAAEFDGSAFDAYTQDTNKYYTTPAEDKKNKFYKSFLMVYEADAQVLQTQPAFTFTFDAAGYKGLALDVATDGNAPAERINIDGVGSYAVANNAGVRTVTITSAGGSITVSVSDNVTDDTTTPAATDNSINIIKAAFRRGSSYDVTTLDA